MSEEEKELKLNWTIKEYIGSPIFKKDDVTAAPLLNENDLKEGDEIVCFSWFFTVEKSDDGILCGTNKRSHAILEFAKDDRKCWVCGGIVNLNAIRKLTKDL